MSLVLIIIAFTESRRKRPWLIIHIQVRCIPIGIDPKARISLLSLFCRKSCNRTRRSHHSMPQYHRGYVKKIAYQNYGYPVVRKENYSIIIRPVHKKKVPAPFISMGLKKLLKASGNPCILSPNPSGRHSGMVHPPVKIIGVRILRPVRRHPVPGNRTRPLRFIRSLNRRVSLLSAELFLISGPPSVLATYRYEGFRFHPWRHGFGHLPLHRSCLHSDRNLLH